MAKTRHEPLQDLPPASLSEEESTEEASSSEIEEEEEEAKSPLQTSSGEPESDNEPESETAVSPVASSALMKKTKRRRIEETTTSMSERQEENDEKEIGTETTKKSYFQRLWSEEDDLVILQGMINFKNETGKTHSEDMDGFYESVKDSITFKGKNLNRLVNKIRTLRKKYMTKRKKGVAPSFPKPMDKQCFELSELIWGSEVESKKKKAKLESSKPEGKKMVETDWIMNSFVGESISSFGMDEERVKQKWSLLPAETKKKVYDKWQMLEYKSVEVVVQKIGLVREVASLLA